MAYFDNFQASLDLEAKEQYEQLKKDLGKLNRGKIHKRFQALQHMEKLEIDLEKLETQNKKYKEFFEMLSNLLPAKSPYFGSIL